MNRREFAAVLGGAAAGSALGPLVQAASGDPAQVSAQAQALYRRALVLDCNSSPPMGEGQTDLDRVRDSGINVIKLSLGGINSDFTHTVADIGQIQQLIEVHPDYYTQVRIAADLERAKQQGKLGIILSFESVDMLRGQLSSLEVFRDLGVRVMQLSYNRRSPFAAGVMEPAAGGLTPLGREAVREMNRLGVAVDLSHANAATTADALALSSEPVLMTHAGCVAIHAHPRNKTDEQLRALAAKGGVVGIFDLPYLTASPRHPRLDD